MTDIRLQDRERHRADWRARPLLLMRLKLAVRIWSLIILVLAKNDDLSRLLRLAGPARRRIYEGLASETIWRCCHRTVKQPILMRERPCLREGLLLNRFLVMAGYEPTLHFGVDKNSVTGNAVRAHLWVKLGERVFNPPEPAMIEIHSHSDTIPDIGPRPVVRD